MADSAGTVLAINTYDEFGIPASTNVGRFQFSRGSRPSGGRGRPETQAWLPEAGLFYYKARMYSPTLGRFLQTDPIGYADGLNWYTYVGGDPVNGVDPLGLQGSDIVVTGDIPGASTGVSRLPEACSSGPGIVHCYNARGRGLSISEYLSLLFGQGSAGSVGAPTTAGGVAARNDDIVVTANNIPKDTYLSVYRPPADGFVLVATGTIRYSFLSFSLRVENIGHVDIRIRTYTTDIVSTGSNPRNPGFAFPFGVVSVSLSYGFFRNNILGDALVYTGIAHDTYFRNVSGNGGTLFVTPVINTPGDTNIFVYIRQRP